MIKNTLISIRDKVIENQPYFTHGFHDVYQDINGTITNGEQIIFPDDSLGDYFYLRIPDTSQFVTNNTFKISGCAGNGYQSNSVIYLVACVRNACPDTLLSNLVNLLRTYQGVILRDWVHQSGVVVRRELAGIKSEEAMAAALQRLDENYTIVSVGFSVIVPMTTYTKADCLPNPCKSCE